MQSIKKIIIEQINTYKTQKKNTENQVHMLEGAIQGLELLLKELESSEPITAGPSIKESLDVSNN